MADSLLIVDDEKDTSESLKMFLDMKGFAVRIAFSGQEGITAVREAVPDLVMLDLQMPGGLDGWQTLKQMKQIASGIRVVIVTGSTPDRGLEQLAIQEGAIGIITKPIDLDDLKLKIVRTLSLDTSSRYFQQTDGVFVFRLPPQFTRFVANDVTLHLRRKMAEAVDGGLDKMVMDLGQVEKADVGLVKLGLSVVQMCQELSVHLRVIASAAVLQECAQFEETREWPYSATCAEAIATLHGRQPAPV